MQHQQQNDDIGHQREACKLGRRIIGTPLVPAERNRRHGVGQRGCLGQEHPVLGFQRLAQDSKRDHRQNDGEAEPEHGKIVQRPPDQVRVGLGLLKQLAHA